MNYTREQLIQAQQKYNQEYVKDPEGFEPSEKIDGTMEFATGQVDYLLGFVE